MALLDEQVEVLQRMDLREIATAVVDGCDKPTLAEFIQSIMDKVDNPKFDRYVARRFVVDWNYAPGPQDECPT